MTSLSEPTEIRKLPIRYDGPSGNAPRVYCPRREQDLDLDACTACAQCIGLSLRDSYLVCGWDPQPHAPLAPPAHPLRRALAAVTADLNDSVLEAAWLMRDHNVGCIVVTRDGKPAGVVTERDLVLCVLAERLDPATTPLSCVFATLDDGAGEPSDRAW
ncbi:CBS domain-containing protein [Polyangium aurulentum]|uniref:CBS domain-containing protein n=1 Tax=Polyangium aurulentum TaxID=2567896 RepID=UPI0010ADDC49|nr:CBS domain-containing protein [Polyangium aurulentum]UQA62559.1 CBS domain-containing protein [Polyangium aurulentum]